MNIGEYELKALEVGRFRLDGGAMFGHVPRTLWSRDYEPDANNRIELALRCLYVEGYGRRILIDTGIGDKWDEKYIDMFDIRLPEGGMAGVLEKIGVQPDWISDVILTHLHFDHAGGATRREGDEIVPTFPNAMYHLQRRNLEWAKRPNPKERASYRPENFEVLEEQDRFVLHDGPRELFPNITALPSDGHTEGLQVIRIASGSDALFYCADLVPMTSHVRLPYTMGYDNLALRVVEEKRALLEGAAERGSWVFYEHDPKWAASKVSWDGNRFSAVEMVETI